MDAGQRPIDEVDALPRLVVVYGPDQRLWLRLGDRSFPEEDWSDLPHTLAQWTPQVLPLLVGGPGLAELFFFDGPYRATVESPGTWRWRVTLIDHRRRSQVDVDGSSFGRSLLGAARHAAQHNDEVSPWVAHIERALASSRD